MFYDSPPSFFGRAEQNLAAPIFPLGGSKLRGHSITAGGESTWNLGETRRVNSMAAPCEQNAAQSFAFVFAVAALQCF